MGSVATAAAPAATGKAGDFDFLSGRSKIANRQLRNLVPLGPGRFARRRQVLAGELGHALDPGNDGVTAISARLSTTRP